MADTDMTLHEAAAELGVHYMTAYRYVRHGQLQATKQRGTWRVARADLDALVADAAGASASAGTGAGTNRRQSAPWGERLEARLVAGDGTGAWGVIEAALAAGTELDEVYLQVLSPAMASIGERWQRGELDISVEHRATAIALRLVGRLGPRFARRGRPKGTVVLGSPSGEHHALAVAMLADLVRLGGWEVVDLGADLPVGSFVYAVRDTADVVAVGVSVMTDAGLAMAQETLAGLRANIPNVLLVVGGPAVRSSEHAVELGADATAWSAAEFVELLERYRAA